MFDTKIAIVLRNDLLPWQALNVTAFLVSGIVAQYPGITGQPYLDRHGNVYNPLSVQPIIILSADQEAIRAIHQRSLERSVVTSAFVEEMFRTGYDVANREAFGQFGPGDDNLVGIALRTDKKLVDKITKGAQMYL